MPPGPSARHHPRAGRRLLRHERPGGGRRRARSGQDGRQDAFTFASGKLRAVDVTGARPRLLDLARARQPHGLRAAAARRPPAPARERRLLDRAAARDGRLDRAATAGEDGPHRGGRVRSGCCGSRTLELDGSYVAARLVGSVVRIVAGAQIRRRCLRPADGRLGRGDRRRQAQERGRRREVEGGNWPPSYRIKRAGAKAGAARPSSSAATCAARRRSPDSGC